jgi:hypothetical protein
VPRLQIRGISFWLPGLFGSLAAVPGQPGPSFTTPYVHTSVAAGGNKTFPLNGQIVAGLKGGGNLVAFGPTYIFDTPVLGGQAALSLLGIGGRSDALISATLTEPRGNTLSGTRNDSRVSAGEQLVEQNETIRGLISDLDGPAVVVTAQPRPRLGPSR